MEYHSVSAFDASGIIALKLCNKLYNLIDMKNPFEAGTQNRGY